MKVLVGGEIESELYEQFRLARNEVLEALDDIRLSFIDVNEISLYIFLLKNFDTSPENRYLKKYKRIEIEVVIPFELFKNLDETEKVNQLKKSIVRSIDNFQNRHLMPESWNLIKEEIKKRLC